MQFEQGEPLRPQGHQPDVEWLCVDAGEVHLVAAHQQFDGGYPAAAE